MTHEKTVVRRWRAMFWVMAVLVTAVMFSLIIRNETAAQKEISIIGELPKTAFVPTEVYSNNFESAVGSEWLNVQTNQIPATSVTPVGARRFLGEFFNNEIRLSLNNLPAHNRVFVVFDLYVIRSWDGNVGGPDIFQVKADGQNVIRTTFGAALGGSPQSYPDQYPNGSYPFGTGSSEVNTLGYIFNGMSQDSVYQVSQAISHSSNSLQISFSANGLSPNASDESWGIDNVRVIVDTLANDTQTTLMPYESGGYRYQILPMTQTVPAGFEQPNYNDSAWSVGQASFGYNDGCVFPFNLKTHWQTNTRLILRKNVNVPPGATNLGVKLSVDNDIEKIWFNGTEIAGLQENSNCPLRDEYGYSIPQNLVQTGNNLIAYQVIDRGRQTFFDSRIVADYPVSCSIPTNGLVSWYRGEGNANDSVGTNNGTLQNGATFAPGKIGQGFSFDGINDSISFGNSLGNFGTSDFSFDYWIKNNSPRLQTIFGKRAICNNSSFFVSTLHADGKFTIEVDGGSGTYIPLISNQTINDGQFHHIAVVRQANTLKIYIDGVLDNTGQNSNTANIVNSADLLAGDTICPGIVFAGILDEIKLYNRALLATEIYNTYAAGNSQTCQLNSTSKPFDFDGDGKADVSVFRPDNGAWYLQQSANGFTGLQFGAATDKLIPADYDGDGKTDVAVYRSGVWYLQRSQLGFTGVTFGDGNDIPQPADFDGDGKAELAVFRPSNGTWYVLNLVNNQFNALQFGQNGDKPVVADYDGDGKADYAVYRGGTWYLQRSQLGFTGVPFGDANDKPVQADYDGDGKADVAVFRPSNGVWYLLRSQTGFTGVQFGLGTDLPTPADYDGDGKTDVAVFRNGTWYLNRTTAGFTGVAFGTATDKPIPNAFVP